VQRTLRFAQYLPRFGWQPLVLTVHPMAYEAKNHELNQQIPPGLVVSRALALDCARHLALCGRYWGALARPDRWSSWRIDALHRARALIRTHRPDVIWSTFPIASAHLIAATLARETGLPWVADFRDPMAQNGYPSDPKTWAQWAAIEKEVFARASRVVFTAPGALRFYQQRFQKFSSCRMGLIENGFDEESFGAAASLTPLCTGLLTLLHSGLVYPSERDPKPLLSALSALRNRPGLPRFMLKLRAPGKPEWLEGLIQEHGIGHLISLAPPLPYQAALQEMERADALVVMQAKNCNDQIPAKLYEYFRARRPILGLTDPMGDTAALIRRVIGPSATLIDPANPHALIEGLPRFLSSLLEHAAPLPDTSQVFEMSRVARTRQLAELLTGTLNAFKEGHR
jgi:hypothetical protein